MEQLIIRGITKLVIPSSVKTSNIYCFADNTELVSVELHSKTIGWSSFSGCSKLESMTIGEELESISWKSFGNCTNLTTLTYQGTIEQWNSISKNTSWINDSVITKIICSDGEIDL